MTTAVPSGPPDTRPPTQPPPPPPPPRGLADGFLREIDGLLIEALAMASLLQLPADRIEECGQVILEFRLTLARRAVADLVRYVESPARRDRGDAVAPADGPAHAALPRADRAGSLPLPPGAGRGFPLPQPSGPPRFDDGERCAYGCTRETPCHSARRHWWLGPPAVAPFPERTPAFEIGTGPVYDALRGRSS